MEAEGLSILVGNGPSGMMLINARNGFNELSPMVMLWTVWHWWQQGTHFLFNCYHHWAILVICQPGQPAVFMHSKEGFMQGDSTFMISYRITLVPLAEELSEQEDEVLPPFYVDYFSMDRPARANARLIRHVMERGPDRGYFSKL
eukprot:646279-Ditylum_brightwellii.AAC.1